MVNTNATRRWLGWKQQDDD